ncbi:MAG: hypothetical protein KDB14_27835 [Planctomycetales bacterium]|nr:hypothetical protein [Planctomycetales bacterium]
MTRLKRFWNDECGGLLSAEYLLLGTLLAIGLIVSVKSVQHALIQKIAMIASVVCQ